MSRCIEMMFIFLVGMVVSMDTTAADPDIKDPGPDFGFIPNAIGIVPPGRLYLESSIEFDHTGADHSARLPLLLRLGAAPDVEIRMEAWIAQEEHDGALSTTGSGPVQVGLKRRLSAGGVGARYPAYGFEVELLLPVSSGGYDSGKIEPSVFFNADHTLSPGRIFTWNVGLLTPVDESGDQFLQGFLAGAYSFFVHPEVELYATGSVNHPASSGHGGGSNAVLGLGGYWYVNHRIVLFSGYNAGLTSDSPSGSGVIGASFAF